MKKLLVAFAGIGLLGGAALAAAQDGPPPRPGGPGMLFADPNGDGVVTKDELLANAAARFAQIDTNKDGTISEEERAAAGGPGRGPGGGATTLAEQQERLKMMFDRMDTNQDGKIDQTERGAMRGRFGGRGPGGPGGPPSSPPAPDGK